MSEPRAPYGGKDFEIFVPHEYTTYMFRLKRSEELKNYINSTVNDESLSEERKKEIFESSFPLFEYWSRELSAMGFIGQIERIEG